MNKEQQEQQIWEYIDGQLSLEQSDNFEQSLSKDSNLNRSYQEILVMHQTMNMLTLPDVSYGFSDKVIQQLDSTQSSSFHVKWILSSTLMLSLLTVVLTLVNKTAHPGIGSLSLLEQKVAFALNTGVFSYLLVFAFIPVLFLLDRYLDVSKIKGNRMFVLSF